MKFIFLAFCLFFIASCRTEAKMTLPTKNKVNAATDAEVGTATDADGATKSKLTLPVAQKDLGMQLGMNVFIDRVDDGRGLKLAKQFEAYKEKFQPCVRYASKMGLVKLKANFILNKNGRLIEVRVTDLAPESEGFKDCFLKVIKDLEFTTQPSQVNGTLTLTTHFGPNGS